MPPLKEKAKRRKLAIIIGDTQSAGPHVKEQTIKIDPKVKGRGTGTIGATIGKRSFSTRTTGGATAGMGGRH